MKKIFLILFTAFVAVLFLFPTKTFAEEIRSFDTAITAHRDGGMDVSEKINYDFEDVYRHGIYRYIPTYTKVGNPSASSGQALYRISKFSNIRVLRDGKKEQFSNNSDAKQLSLKIGNPDKEITGLHLYEIDYTVTNGIGSNYSDHDEIYWNGTGNGWDTDIDRATITFNTDLGVQPLKILCFTGPYGSKDTNCSVSKNMVATSSLLYSSEGLTAVAVYPARTFPKSFLSKEPPSSLGEKFGSWFLKNLGNIWLFLNVVLPIVLFVWWKLHKNKERFGKPAVSFDLPKDGEDKIEPALAGAIDTGKITRDDVTATIFDLAIRKYIKLIGTKKVRNFAPDTADIKIRKLKSSQGLNEYETTLYDRLFEAGDEVDVKDLRSDFYSTYAVLEDQVFNELKKKGYFVRNPKYEKGILIFLGTIALFTLNMPLAIIIYYLSRKLMGRTQKGDEMDFQVDGLKLFLKSQLRNYNFQAKKFYTVEAMIPYAMALGFINQFMEQLKIINPNYNPTWYTGYNGSFYTNYALFTSGISSNITTAAPSSSGSGGGGFSGGGGGGGGGGSW